MSSPRPGDLLLSHDVKFKGVRIPQYHYAIMGNDGHVIEANVNRGGGVFKVPYDKWAALNRHTVQRVKGASDEDRARAVDIAEGFVGKKKYGYAKAVGAFVKPDKYSNDPHVHNEKTQFCSGVIGAAYPKIAETKGKHTTHVMPWDIHHSAHVENADGSKKKFVSKKKMIAGAAIAAAVPAAGYLAYRHYKNGKGVEKTAAEVDGLEVAINDAGSVGRYEALLLTSRRAGYID